MNSLSEHVAVVTGAGQGVGRAIAKALAAHGCKVAVNDVSEERANRVVAEIAAAGGMAQAAVADISQRDAVERMMAATAERLGGPDILVNCARVEPPRPASVSLDEWWDRVLAVDLKGAYLCAMAMWPGMEKKGFGRVINISSVQGVMGKPDDEWIAYSCAKAGMFGLTRSLARRGMRLGITANTVTPDYIETEVMKTRWPAEKLAEFAASVPLGRPGQPQDVADAVLFLVNASFITGENIAVNGGRFVAP